jgi:hypothetical protein
MQEQMMTFQTVTNIAKPEQAKTAGGSSKPLDR